MARARRGRTIAAFALAGLLAACGMLERGRPADGRGGLRLSFEDRAEPEVFTLEGSARRDAAEGAAGLWAAVGGLPRPERARVENLETGATVEVALFRDGTGIRLSGEAADALGIGEAPVRVRITALRREPVIEVGDDAF